MDVMVALTGIAALTRHFLKKLVLGRKVLISLLVAAFVAVVMGYAGSQGTATVVGGTDLLDVLILFFFMPVMAMIYGTSLIRDEIDDKSITHVATAPLDRGLSYIGYYVPLALTVSVTMVVVNAAGFLAYFSQVDLGGEALEVWGEFTVLVVVGSFVYSALFLAVSVLLKKPIFFGLFYAFIWEGLIGSLQGAIQKVSVKHYLRSIGSGWTDQGSMSAFADATDPGASWLVLAALAVALVLLGAVLFRETELA
jgi:ABC-2 type transport system permease protein